MERWEKKKVFLKLFLPDSTASMLAACCQKVFLTRLAFEEHIQRVGPYGRLDDQDFERAAQRYWEHKQL